MSAPPPPPLAPKTVPAQPKKWTIKTSDDKEKYAVPADIRSIQWREALGYSTSESGAEGVLFVGFKEDKVVVVKSSSTAMADYFAAELGKMVNMPFPDIRLVRWQVDHEISMILTMVESLSTLKKEGERRKVAKFLTFPILMIMEYISGDNIYQINPAVTLGDNEQGHAALQDIGRVLSFDMLINNWDRLPLIWNHEGNAGNFIFPKSIIPSIKESRSVVGIDQTISSIEKELDKFKEYTASVESFVNEIIGESDYPTLTKIRTFIQNSIGYDIGSEGQKWLRIGILKGIKDIAINITRSKVDKLNEECVKLTEQLRKRMSWGFDSHSKYGLVRINVEFVDAILNIFVKYLPEVNKLLQ